MPDERMPGYKGVRKFDRLADHATSVLMGQEDAMLLARNLIESKEWWVFFPVTQEAGLFIGEDVEDKFYGVANESAWDFKVMVIVTPLGACMFQAAHKSRMSAGDLSMILEVDIGKKDILYPGGSTPSAQALWVLDQVYPNENKN